MMMVEQLRQVAREEKSTMSEILRAIIRPFLEGRRLREEGLRPSQSGPVEPISRALEDLEAPGRVGASGPVSGDSIIVFGVDFTSAPTKRKPILGIECQLVGDVLEIVEPEPWHPLKTFGEFEESLKAGPRPGSKRWVAGADLPFGLSIRFIDNMGWPRSWGEYIDRHLAPLCRQGKQGRRGWRHILDEYKEARPFGDKEHLRRTDELAGSLSPQKQYGIPVGLMLLEGAPRLRASGVTIPGLQEGSPERIVMEAYPGIVVYNLMGEKISYKTDTARKQTAEQRRNRRLILETLLARSYEIYGIRVQGTERHDVLFEDGTGDHLDALLCAVQAAWGWRNWNPNFGTLPICPTEGAIADPMVLQNPMVRR